MRLQNLVPILWGKRSNSPPSYPVKNLPVKNKRRGEEIFLHTMRSSLSRIGKVSPICLKNAPHAIG
jgi:hypothetical protein